MQFERSDRWVKEYQERGALWIHDGNPKRPHALLTSGKHSSGFFNSGLVTEDPSLLTSACIDLVGACLEQVNLAPVNFVIGPALGAVTMAHCIALALQNSLTHRCLTTFTEKVDTSDGPQMVLRRRTLSEGDEVLVVEDVLTTGGSVERTIEAVSQSGGHAAPIVAVLVNRSGLDMVRGGRKIVSLIDRAMPMWAPGKCPFCEQGSEAIRPKDADNWSRLNANYPG